MMRKLLLPIIFCLAFTPLGIMAQKQDSGKSKEKTVLKVSKDDLKNKVKTRSNGDTMVGTIKLELKYYQNIPSYLDSYLAHFFPSLDLADLDERIAAWKKKNEYRDPPLEDMFGGINSALSRQNVRLKAASPGDTNVRTRIKAGIPLYWAASVNYDFVAFLYDRGVERGKYKNLAEWKKVLNTCMYKEEPEYDKRKALYFFIVGFNSLSGEIAIATSPDMETIFWISPAELRKYTYMIWEPIL